MSGVLVGIITPLYGGDTSLFFENIFTHVLHIGRYLIFPLLFFTITISSYELWREKKFFQTYGRIMGYAIISSVVLAVVGAIFVAIFSPERVPIIIEETVVNPLPSISNQILMIFPKNLFTAFTNNGDFLLPLIIFAIILGIALFHNHSLSPAIIEIFDNISQILYKMNRFVLEIIGLGIVFMSAYWIIQLKSMADLVLFGQLLLVILLAMLFIIFLVIPGLLYFLSGRRRNPYTWLFAILPAAFSSLLSGDSNFTISAAIAVLNENMGMDKRTTPAMVSLNAVFSRSGIAMVTCISFILIIRSYSSLDVTFLQYLWVIGSSILISFMLGTVPVNAVLVSLAVISGWYAQGLEKGFLILLPIAPIITSLAVLLDTVVIMFNCQLIADGEKQSKLAKVKNFL